VSQQLIDFEGHMITSPDSSKPKRSRRGEFNGSAKLTAAQVQEMRRVHDRTSRESNTKALAQRYGITTRAVRLILSGKRWSDAPQAVSM
jgi:hypothetical protein